LQRTEYVLLNAASTEREEVAAIVFDRMDVMTSITEGSQPRKLMVVVPPLDDRGMPIPNRVAIGHEEYGSMLNVLRYPASTSGLYLMQTKEPTFINGNYRLNFRGRVKIPSVKNFQIVSAEDTNDVIVQFGKIGDDRFHLDFKAPFSAFQAFSLALSQFNL
jgi:tubby and related proteins